MMRIKLIYKGILLDREDDEPPRVLLQQRLLRVHRLGLGRRRVGGDLAGLQGRVVGDFAVLVLLVGQVQLGDDVCERHDGGLGG